jgi:2-methylcitrate dehydratase PrpD
MDTWQPASKLGNEPEEYRIIKKLRRLIMNQVSAEIEGLSRFAVETRWEDLPPPVIQGTKMLFLDSLGCGLAGIVTDPGKMIIALSQRLGGPPEASIIGVGGKVSCVNAVLANGQLINAIDYEALSGHTPPYIIPPPLAMAECNHASGQDLILATAIGLEMTHRIAGAISWAFFGGKDTKFSWATRSGYASSNFGAAAAAGKIIKLNQSQMMNALGTAGHMSQVLTWIRYTFQDHRAMTKYGVPGWQNTGGLMAALLAEMGFIGDTTVFDEKEGFWKFAGYENWNPGKILEGLGQNWNYFTKIQYKWYPCCRMFQTELDCFLKILEDHHLRPEEIETVEVYGHPTLEAPAFTNREIASIVDIQFSPAYIFAMAANNIPKGVDWQDLEIARSSRIQDFARKVNYQAHPEFGAKIISMVEVTARGKKFKEEKRFVDVHALTQDELIAKFKHNASRILTERKIENAINGILELDKITDIAKIMSQVTM